MAKRMTNAEFSFYKHADWRFKNFRTQQVFECGGESGKLFIVDFWIPDSKLCIEIDGNDHQSKVKYDANRTGLLNQRRFTVLRFPNQLALDDPEFCVSIVSQWHWHFINGNAITNEALEYLDKADSYTINPDLSAGVS
jgi:very-short-patch-repair endonuclease